MFIDQSFSKNLLIQKSDAFNYHKTQLKLQRDVITRIKPTWPILRGHALLSRQELQKVRNFFLAHIPVKTNLYLTDRD